MNIGSINNINFGATFSRDLESKLIAHGKYLQRSNQTKEYEELKKNVQVIKAIFPDGRIVVKPTCKLEVISDLSGQAIFKIPVQRAGIFLERYGEADVSLIKNGLLSTNFILEPAHIREIRARLERYKHFLDVKIKTNEFKEAELSNKVKNDLL